MTMKEPKLLLTGFLHGQSISFKYILVIFRSHELSMRDFKINKEVYKGFTTVSCISPKNTQYAC